MQIAPIRSRIRSQVRLPAPHGPALRTAYSEAPARITGRPRMKKDSRRSPLTRVLGLLRYIKHIAMQYIIIRRIRALVRNDLSSKFYMKSMHFAMITGAVPRPDFSRPCVFSYRPLSLLRGRMRVPLRLRLSGIHRPSGSRRPNLSWLS
jgi:hypothetical protein